MVTVLQTIESGSFDERVNLGSFVTLSGVSVPSMTVLYPDKDIWFDGGGEIPVGDSDNRAIFPETNQVNKILSTLNATDPQRIPIALLGGKSEPGMWGFDQDTRKTVLRRYRRSLPGILHTYISLAYRDIPILSMEQARVDLGITWSGVQHMDTLSHMIYPGVVSFNDEPISSLLQGSLEFQYLEYATCVNLENFLDKHDFLAINEKDAVLKSSRSARNTLMKKIGKLRRGYDFIR